MILVKFNSITKSKNQLGELTGRASHRTSMNINVNFSFQYGSSGQQQHILVLNAKCLDDFLYPQEVLLRWELYSIIISVVIPYVLAPLK